jgi:hypothetical protein
VPRFPRPGMAAYRFGPHKADPDVTADPMPATVANNQWPFGHDVLLGSGLRVAPIEVQPSECEVRG